METIITMLQDELIKNQKKVDILSSLKSCKTLNDIKNIITLQGGQTKITRRTANNSTRRIICFHNDYSDFLTFEISENTITDDIQDLLKFPEKYITEIEFLLTDNNIKTAIQEFEYIERLRLTANKVITDNNFNRYMGCMVSKYICNKHDEIGSKYYWRFGSNIESEISSEIESITDLEDTFKKCYILQNEMWGMKVRGESTIDNRDKIKNILNEYIAI